MIGLRSRTDSNEPNAGRIAPGVVGVFLFLMLSVLAGMLLPALGRTPVRAKFVRCANNMRQLLLAYQQYRVNNDDWAPYAENWDKPEGRRGILLYHLVYPYMDDKEVFCCPGADPEHNSFDPDKPMTQTDFMTIGINNHGWDKWEGQGCVSVVYKKAPGEWERSTWTQMWELVDASELIVWGDSTDDGDWDYAISPTQETQQPLARHAGMCNIAWFDGHCSRHSKDWLTDPEHKYYWRRNHEQDLEKKQGQDQEQDQ